MPAHDVPARSTRDRIIDLLGIGDTYPLTDVNVLADHLKVPFGGTAKIPIAYAQAGVTYQLCDPAGKPLGAAFAAEGNDATVILESPTVREDVTYRIRAMKGGAVYLLDEGAPVKVGIDADLIVEILAGPLDSGVASPQPSDPRIIPYGVSADVRIDKSQEGVQYSLVIDDKDLTQLVIGDLHDVVLSTGPMFEDAVIQVRATKKFLAPENRTSETILLNATRLLAVRANPKLAISLDPSPVLDYQRAATIKIENTQASAKYRAYARPIRDVEFARDATDEEIVTVPVDGPAAVRKPPIRDPWMVSDGYTPLGDGPVPGTGGDVLLTAAAGLVDDSTILVQAVKEHSTGVKDPEIIGSAVALEQLAVALVRPDPDRALRLRVPVIAGQTADTIQVSNGQPGVLYYFQWAAEGAEFPWPAYFHKREDQDNTANKGIGQLGVEIDFVVATDSDGPPSFGTNHATTPPRSPLLAITPVPAGDSLSSRAVKAQTLVESPMSQRALVAVVPDIRADQAVIDYASAATILIPASNREDVYQVTLMGAAVGPALAGDGTDLAVATNPQHVDAVFNVLVTRPADTGMAVERVVQVAVLVRPNTALPVAAKLDVVNPKFGTDIVVQESQPGVLYRLMSGPTAIGAAVLGTGDDIALPTGPIVAATVFTVAATRADNPQITVLLQATVQLAPGV